MAVDGIAQERPDSPDANFEVGKHVITREFRVKTSSVLDGPMTVTAAVGLPRLFQTYQFGNEIHPYCRCRSIDPQRLAKGSLEWEVTCHYETPPSKNGSQHDGGHDSNKGDGGGTGVEKDQQFDNPLAALPEIETHWETQQQPIYGVQGMGQTVTMTNGNSVILTANTAFYSVGDTVIVTFGNILITTTITAITPGVSITLGKNWTGRTGSVTLTDISFRPCQSSAGEVFVPPPMMDQGRLTLTITRNEDINSPVLATAVLFQDTVNSDVFWGANPGQVKCQSITSQRQNKQLPDGSVFPYLRVTYLFHFRQTWDIQLLDKGSYFNVTTSVTNQQTGQVTTTVEPNKFLTQDGQPRDGLLDGKGGKLAVGATPVFLTVRPYNWQPFATFNLPQAFNQVQ